MPFRWQGAICSGCFPSHFAFPQQHPQVAKVLPLVAGSILVASGHLGELPGLASPSCWRLCSRWAPTRLSEVSATCNHAMDVMETCDTSDGGSTRSLQLCSLSALLWAISLPAELQPGASLAQLLYLWSAEAEPIAFLPSPTPILPATATSDCALDMSLLPAALDPPCCTHRSTEVALMVPSKI